ncbi:MAG: hypothetical protein GWN07_21150, partial [Actinobacteria bacterium]|nr:hypothetical protein [Actinomycetota bacterium]NIS32971.1 hypothetical protein [Actinomycetota bacterium]NIW29696.1 hypothetical protein [Actinomycetota bacterium]NIX22199.1 hypothetical protein [Actinomycetota bacterium]
CFYYLYYLEMACKIQVDVMGSGAEPILVAEDVVNGLFDRAGPDEAPAFSAGVWPA